MNLVLGLGISGMASAAFLLKRGEGVVAVDRHAARLKTSSEVEPLLALGLKLFSDEQDLPLDSISKVILSPGVPPTHPLVLKANKMGIEVIGEIEMALRSIKNRCVAVTGTNGKTTTVLLIAHILNSAGIAARALGNVGDSLAGYLLDPEEKEVLVLELSSFQLETMGTKCLEGAVILNITPDHLDRYPSIREYAAAKFKIGDCLLPGKVLWISRQIEEEFGLKGERFDPTADYEPWTEEKLRAHSKIRSIQLGMPERQNIQAAYAICHTLGVSKMEFARGLETFRKPEHRIEWVAEKNGILFYNDSKATNIDSVMHAVNLFEEPIILLAGGVDKGASYTPWIDCFKKKVKMIIAFGQAASKMESELASAFPFRRTATMKEAIELSLQWAEKGTSVLLSPGCSSFDQFRNYEHRGDEFKRLVREWV